MAQPTFNYTIELGQKAIIKMMTFYSQEKAAQEIADFYLKKLRNKTNVNQNFL